MAILELIHATEAAIAGRTRASGSKTAFGSRRVSRAASPSFAAGVRSAGSGAAHPRPSLPVATIRSAFRIGRGANIRLRPTRTGRRSSRRAFRARVLGVRRLHALRFW